MNHKLPRTVSWGTPVGRRHGFDMDPLHQTTWVRPAKYELNHFKVLFQIF